MSNARGNLRSDDAVPVEPVRAWLLEAIARGRTRIDLARETGITYRHIYRIINGPSPSEMRNGKPSAQARFVSVDLADRVALATGHYLYEIDDAA